MKTFINTILFFLVFSLSMRAWAESPIKSVAFYPAYDSSAMVQKAMKATALTDSIASFLLNDSNTIEKKAAVINALTFGGKGKENAPLLVQYLLKKYGVTNGFDLGLLSADDIFCLGYFTITDNQDQIEKSISVLQMAQDKKPKSFTIALVIALTRAEEYYKTDKCKAYKVCANVKNDKFLELDMKQKAIDLVYSVTNTYSASCVD